MQAAAVAVIIAVVLSLVGEIDAPRCGPAS